MGDNRQGESDTTKALILLSGGIDSSACTYFYKSQGFLVETLFLNYGQAAEKKEEIAAQRIAETLDVPLSTIKLERRVVKTFKGEIIGRNALFLFAALMEFQNKNGIIGIGIHSDTPYYDCSLEFVKKIQETFDGYTDGCIRIGAPFLDWSKADVWEYFIKSGIPSELTYSCELGLSQPCGKCLSCKDLEALNVC